MELNFTILSKNRAKLKKLFESITNFFGKLHNNKANLK